MGMSPAVLTETIWALLYACMTLIGRETDRLTHVLVQEPYDDARLTPRFYFPDQPSESLRLPNGKTVRARDAAIELADIPFVPLRNRFMELGSRPGRFGSMVASCSRLLAQDRRRKVRIEVDAARGVVTVDGLSVRLRSRSIQTLRFLLEINEKGVWPAGQPEAIEPMRRFLGGENTAWLTDADDLKRELSEIRRRFAGAGIAWAPGTRRQSLVLPPFTTGC